MAQCRLWELTDFRIPGKKTHGENQKRVVEVCGLPGLKIQTWGTHHLLLMGTRATRQADVFTHF
jgi:hypothetical protein